jgi:GMP synthase-like glutamine amidotransferase
MLLVINCVVNPEFVNDFNRIAVDAADGEGMSATLCRVGDLPKLTDLSPYTHILISGSETPIVEDQPWEPPLAQMIRKAVEGGKPTLGICYGHQMIVKALLGRDHVRKAEVPEFGWKEIGLAPNPLFEDLLDPVFMVSHFDEVCALPPEFEILAATRDCAVHAYQVKDKPVWGVQFHPEYGIREAEAIFEKASEKHPEVRRHFWNELMDRSRLVQNRRILANFLRQGG